MSRGILFAQVSLVSVLFFAQLNVFTQVGINSDGSNPHPSAGLDVDFTNRGFLPPRLTTSQRNEIPSPLTDGLTIFNTSTLCLETYISGVWQPIGCGCSEPPSSPVASVPLVSANQIVWIWNAVSGASGYKCSPVNEYEGATDIAVSGTFIQSGINCGDPVQTLFVWAYNSCGNSSPVQLTATPFSLPSVPSISGTATLNAGATTQLSNSTPGGIWSSSDLTRATVSNTGLVTAIMQGSVAIEYSVTLNGCTATVSQLLTINWVCGTPLPKTHTEGTVAPITKSVNYPTVLTSLSGASKCWIGQNLGAGQQASSATDTGSEPAGWYWQFNRKRGFLYSGGGPTPTWSITSISEGLSWASGEDPCLIELGSGWRLPLNSEYINVDANGGWNTYVDSYNSVLKIHAAGHINATSGLMEGLGSAGAYWASTSANNTEGKFLWVRSNGSSANHDGGKAWGFPLRCIKD